MKKTVFLSLILCSFGMFAFKTNANTPDFSYSVHTPYEFVSSSQNYFANDNDKQILFIIDFSNSMNNLIDGKSKIDMARETLMEILPRIPSGVKTGLRIYGHKSGITYLQGCQASTLKVPLGLNNHEDIIKGLYTSTATGWTPITHSLKKAVNSDFAGVAGKKHIVLLTDGGENCDESPCTYAINLMRERDDVKIDVIAFDINDPEANNQLRCTALATSGKFLTADSQENLSKSLFETVGVNKDVRGSIKIPANAD